MSAFVDLTGMKFNRLTVLGIDHKKKKLPHGSSVYWCCKCDCGNISIVDTTSLKSGHSKSCGCLSRETTSKIHKTHGLTNSKLYRTWANIKRRCYNSNSDDYPRYGGRGIGVFEDWINDFQAFSDYVSALPNYDVKGYTLDRINNDGDYAPGNLRWTDRKTQCRNIRRNIIVEYQGELMTLPEAAEKSGINYGCLDRRYRRGDRGERLFREIESNENGTGINRNNRAGDKTKNKNPCE